MLRALIWWIVVGLIAGWGAGKIMKGGGYGTIMDIILGIVGGVVGGWLLGILGIHAGGLIGTIIVSIFGAVVLIWISRIIKKA
ncbi:MAG TPA: GlsB/YeaQ/YmgE family stress response membrane protein [Terriglobales bacterium]|nr:GlsB/YeaQ/YmgE family stress response membrane protein [Terriglobales bacterium]